VAELDGGVMPRNDENNDTLSLIFKARIESSEKEAMYWLWLGSAYSILLSRAPDISAYELDLERAYGAAKQVVMELWAIRAFLVKLNIEINSFDEIVPNLKAFRDAIAHIDERAEGTMLVRGAMRANIISSKTSLAGGLLTTADGIRWTGLNYCYGLIGSLDGLCTTFGLIRDWIITNTDQGAIEIQLTSDLFERLDNFIRAKAMKQLTRAYE
jgi:hypothetical protein